MNSQIISIILSAAITLPVTAAIKQKGNFIICDSVRIELFSPTMFGVTVSDKPSTRTFSLDLAVINRPISTVNRTIKEGNGIINITTDSMTIIFNSSIPVLDGGLKVIKGDLTIDAINTIDNTNLGGVVGALDNCDGETNYSEQNDITSSARYLPIPMDGVLSRRGYSVLNHSGDYLTHYTPGSTYSELIVIAYGINYRCALNDFYSIAGRPSMLPKWSLGFIYSRWKDYTDRDYHDIVEGFRLRNIPIDAIILDMCWHVDHWYGYKYDNNNFPDMRQFLQWAKSEGLKVGFNHHSGSIYKDDPNIHEFCRRAGLDYEKSIVPGPSFEPEIKVVEYDTRNERHFRAFYEIYLDRMIKDGFDFHWVDGANSIYSTDLYDRYLKNQTGLRPFVLNRQQQSILCNHRYPVAFSGDTYATWATMRHTLETTLKGANNGVNWSHDIGGYMPQGADGYKPDGEMFARWVQLGTFSPIMRFHAKKDLFWYPEVKKNGDYDGGSRLPWDWGPTVEKSITSFLQLRAALNPYIYTAMWHNHIDGEPLCRGMYFDWPNKDQAYCYDQFMFGPYILVAPIMSPSGDGQHGSQSRIVWLPEGKWYEYFSGKAVEGGRMIKTESDIYTLPVYIKAGSIIPTVPLRRNVSEPCDTIILTIYPHIGIGSTEYVLYDDAGDAFGFENGERSFTPILFNTNMDETKTITIGATDGTWPNAPAQMNYTIVMVDIPRPISVNVNGKPSQYWQWSDNRLKIETGLVNCDKGVTVNIN